MAEDIKLGITGFEEVVRISKDVNNTTANVFSDNKLEFDKLAGSEKCPKCNSNVAGKDQCDNCGLEHRVSPAFQTKGQVHVRNGYNLSRHFAVMLINHELGHIRVTPASKLGFMKWILLVAPDQWFKAEEKGMDEDIKRGLYDKMWKEQGKKPWVGWDISGSMNGRSDIAHMTNMMQDSIINYFQCFNPELSDDNVFNNDYAYSLMNIYTLNMWSGDKLTCLDELHFRINRGFAELKLKKEVSVCKSCGEIVYSGKCPNCGSDEIWTGPPSLYVKDVEELEKIDDLFYFFVSTVPHSLSVATVVNSGKYILKVCEKYGWFVVDKGLIMGSKIEQSMRLKRLSVARFRAMARLKGYDDKEIDDMIEKLKIGVNWV